MRIFDYDAPELGRPDKLGELARDAVIAWFAQHAGPYRLETHKDQGDKYGRVLIAALLAADHHELINDMIVAGHLKGYTGSGPKPTWP